MVQDPFTCLLGRFDDHVHSLSIAGEITEVDDHFSSNGVTFDPLEFAVTRCGLGRSTNRFEFVREIDSEVMRVSDVFEEEDWGDAIFIQVNASSDTACPRQGNHAALVRTNESSLSCC